jgi:hypothetical protein
MVKLSVTIEAESPEELKLKVLNLAKVFNGEAQLTMPAPVTDKPERRTTKKPKEEKVETTAAASEPTAETPTLPTSQSTPVSKPVTAEDLRAALAKVAGENSQNIEKAREILGKFGARKMSEVKESDYPAFIAACDEAAKS